MSQRPFLDPNSIVGRALQGSPLLMFDPYYRQQAALAGESRASSGLRRGLASTINAVKPFFTGEAGPGQTGSWLADEAAKSLAFATAPAAGGGVATPAPQPAPVQGGVVSSSNNRPLPFSRPAMMSMVDWAKGQGATVTSIDRTPAHNRKVGGVANSFHTRGLAFDSTAPKGMGMGQWAHTLQERMPGWDVINEGDHVHVEPPSGAGPLKAFTSAAQAVGLGGPPPAFHGEGYANADTLLNEAARRQMAPFGATYQTTPMPELPTPEALQAPDFSAGDAAMAAAAPVNPFGSNPEEIERNKLKLRRSEYFAGMGQALAAVNFGAGAGLGELFAKLGGGALMGARQGDRLVEEKLEGFDKAMQQYQMHMANRDDNKAQIAANVANQNIKEMNQYKEKLWATQVREWEKSEPRIENGVLVTKVTGQNGMVTETHTPLDQSRTTGMLMARANNQIAQANAHSQYDWQVFQANRALAGIALPYALAETTSQQQADGIVAIGLTEGADAVVGAGKWADLYASAGWTERAPAVQAEAYAMAGIQLDPNGRPLEKPNEQQMELINNYISNTLVTDFVNGKQSWRLTGGTVRTEDRATGQARSNARTEGPDPIVQVAVGSERERNRRVSQRTDHRGRTSTTITQGGD